MNDCERYEQMISALIDGQLEPEEEAEVRAHMESCPDCAAMYEAFVLVGAAIREQDVPDTLHEGIMAKVRAAEKARNTQNKIVRLRPILAAAACLIVLVGTVFALRNTIGFRSATPESAKADMTMEAPMAPNADTVYSAVTTGSAGPAAAADMAIPEDEAIFDSESGTTGIPMDKPEEVNAAAGTQEAPKEAEKAAVDSGPAARGAMNDTASAERYFTFRVETLTEEGLVGIVTETGNQTYFAEGDRVTVLTESPDTGAQKPGALLSVIITADEQPTGDNAVHALTIAPAE